MLERLRRNGTEASKETVTWLRKEQYFGKIKHIIFSAFRYFIHPAAAPHIIDVLETHKLIQTTNIESKITKNNRKWKNGKQISAAV